MRLNRIVFPCVLAAILFLIFVLHSYIYQMRDKKPLTLIATNLAGNGDILFQEFNRQLSEEVTIVTSYINLGTFDKGDYGNRYNPKIYKSWMSIFAKIKNPVVAYFCDEQLEKYFIKIRSSQPSDKTKTVSFKESESWAFSLKRSIEDIISSPQYPKFSPNTIRADYGCMMHAKYEFITMTAKRNPFNTKYLAWLDIGLFRDLVSKNTSDFTLKLPPGFDQHKVAYSQVGPFLNLSAAAIFKQNEVLVCGCYFVGKTDVVLSWGSLYKERVEHYLAQGLTNTDQQVLYAMLADNKTLASHVQLYFSKESRSRWFHLGYISKVDIR